MESTTPHSETTGVWCYRPPTKTTFKSSPPTHSWDCVRGFAQAAVENEKVKGVLVRLEKEDDGLRAVRYSERRLKIAAEQRIEVR